MRPLRRWRLRASLRDSYGESLAFWRNKDGERSQSNSLPDDEDVAIPALWVVEVFTPSTLTGLTDGLRKLGWATSERRPHTDIAQDIEQARRQRQGGAAWNIGFVTTPESTNFMSDHRIELPEGVQACFPSVYQITSSLTALVCCFVLSDSAASAMTPVLRKSYTTFFEWTNAPGRVRAGMWRHFGPPTAKSGYSIHPPDFQRQEEATNTFAAARERCERWVSTRFPGAFAGGLRQGALPSAALLVTEKAEPLRSPGLQFLEAIGLRPLVVWKSDEWPACRMAEPRSFGDDSRPPVDAVFAVRRTDAIEGERRKYRGDPDSHWSIAQFANELIPGLLTRFTLSILLYAHGVELARIRDLGANRSDRHRPVRELKEIRGLILDEALDIETSASEIRDLAENAPLYALNILEMEQVERRPVQAPAKASQLLDGLREFQSHNATQLKDDLRILVQALSTSSNITTTISNVRVQRLVLIATLGSLGAAAAAIVIAANSGH